jgi:hypothetical protein
MYFEHVYLLSLRIKKAHPKLYEMSSRWALINAALCTWKVGCAGIYPHSPGVQAVPYRVIDTWGKYSIVDTPMFTYGLLTPSI